VPGAFAVGEAVGASGADVLRVSVVGFEFVIRLALATMPSLLLERGFHHTSVLGGFAVALGAAMLEGDDLDVATSAIAIAGSHASGTTEYARSGGEVKRFHGGMGVAGGIRSERLARLGISGPPTIFEGPRGFLQAFCNGFDPKPLTENLGTRWYFPEMAAIKLYASCGLIHAHFAAFDKIKAEHDVRPDDIREVILGCDELTNVHMGHIGPHPKDVLSAQFSAEFSVAMRILNGKNDVAAYLDLQSRNFQDQAIRSVAERTRLYQVPNFSFKDPKGSVTLIMRDGTKLSSEAYAPGSPGNPVVRADYENKYADLVSSDFGDEIAQRSIDLIMDIENVSDLGEITRLFENPLY
jgi:2-methylcitrate dehydratase PrpD